MTPVFDVRPHVGPLPIRFGMPEGEVIALLGEPLHRGKNQQGEPDWGYEKFSIRFGVGNTGVVEVGFFPEAEVLLSGTDLFRDPQAFWKVVSSNGDAVECYGFIVIPSLSLTFTGFHDGNEEDRAITVFADGRWDDMRSEFRPFRPEDWFPAQ